MSKVVPVSNVPGHFLFDCPGCKCCHAIYTDEFISDNPNHPRWKYNGDPDCPTVTPSIRVFDEEGTICHSYVTAGNIHFLADCRHELAGKIVPIPNFE